MSKNTLLALNIVLRIIGGVVVVVTGAYLILSKHPVAGGWTIFGGILLAGVSISSKSEEDDEDE